MLRKLSTAAILLGTALAFASPAFAVETITIKVASDSKTEVVKDAKAPFTGDRAAVDVAILLDTSNSMDGLINQAKSQLWTIVQQFAQAKKDGKTPTLRVSLFEYGNSKLPAAEGYIRQVVQLTDDLDRVSEGLFSLRTKGGDEYCGQVIKEAIKRLDWSTQANSYKAIFVCGNEPFTQGPVNYEKWCKKAIGKGIVVNTIHCGSYSDGISGQWQAGAQLAEGKFLNINQDKKEVHIKCPQDKIILELNTKLNKTYLWFGEADERGRYARNQIAQDRNASSFGGGAPLSRAIAKGGRGYNNAKRDVIDAVREDSSALAEIPEAKLPSKLQKMSKSEREQHVAKLSAERKQLQEQIAKLNRERTDYITKQKANKTQEGKGATLGDAVTEAVQTQLKASGFEISE